jgi:hypothetical protein
LLPECEECYTFLRNRAWNARSWRHGSSLQSCSYSPGNCRPRKAAQAWSPALRGDRLGCSPGWITARNMARRNSRFSSKPAGARIQLSMSRGLWEYRLRCDVSRPSRGSLQHWPRLGQNMDGAPQMSDRRTFPIARHRHMPRIHPRTSPAHRRSLSSPIFRSAGRDNSEWRGPRSARGIGHDEVNSLDDGTSTTGYAAVLGVVGCCPGAAPAAASSSSRVHTGQAGRDLCPGSRNRDARRVPPRQSAVAPVARMDGRRQLLRDRRLIQ